MAREGIEIRRLAIANELIALAIPRARTDRNFPAWVTRTLSGDRRFGSRDRRFYRELVFTAVRFMPWVEGVAEADRARASLWLSADTNETRDARGILGDTAVRAVAPLTARAAAFNDAFPGAGAQMDSLLPEWTADECPALFSPGETSVVHTRAPLWIRIQTPDPVRIAQELETAGIAIDLDDRIPGAARVVSGPDVTRTQVYLDGLIEVQDIGSQWVLHTAVPSQGELWLDACAGAGGKTLQLAALVGPETPVVAHDIRAPALAELRARAKRAGLTSIRTAMRVEGQFDAVLVDAPCSGSGTWRRSPHLKWQTTRRDIERMASRQLGLLTKYAAHVRPGGRLVYATCSLTASENTGVVARFLEEHPGFVPQSAGAGTPGVTLLPSTLDSDGFFVSELRRAP